MKFAVLLFPAAMLAAGDIHLTGSDLKAEASGWTAWSPRSEIAPRTYLDRVHQRGGLSSLAISGNSNPAAYGGWEYTVQGVAPGKWYRFTGWYRTEGVPYERLQVLSRLDWVRADGKRAGKPEYIYASQPDGEWTRVSVDCPAPDGAAAVKLQLMLQNAPAGTVWWNGLTFDQIAAPGPRPVRVQAVNFRPSHPASSADGVRQFLNVVEHIEAPADIILLPEGITVVGTGKQYADVAETVPGPTTAMLAETARKKKAYIVAGLYEREGPAIYNTAVMVDRAGNVAGKYRKVYLPREEVEHGLTPGFDYPVFRTDFGTVGIMICYDVFFSDPARALALKGAEMILMPIWGGDETLAKARAIENKVFLVASGYDHPTYIMDPEGVRVASAARGEAAIATVDLAHRYWHPQLGDMRARRAKEDRGP